MRREEKEEYSSYRLLLLRGVDFAPDEVGVMPFLGVGLAFAPLELLFFPTAAAEEVLVVLVVAAAEALVALIVLFELVCFALPALLGGGFFMAGVPLGTVVELLVLAFFVDLALVFEVLASCLLIFDVSPGLLPDAAVFLLVTATLAFFFTGMLLALACIFLRIAAFLAFSRLTFISITVRSTSLSSSSSICCNFVYQRNIIFLIQVVLEKKIQAAWLTEKQEREV